MKENRKTLKSRYKESPRPMGVFQIRNLTNEKVLVGSGLDLPGIMNRHRFQLTRGIHQNPKLQAAVADKEFVKIKGEDIGVEAVEA